LKRTAGIDRVEQVFVKPDVITPSNLRTLTDGSDPPVLLDVREPEEVEIVTMPQALHVPLARLESYIKGFDLTLASALPGPGAWPC